MNLIGSPFPRHVVQDTILGPQIPGHAQMVHDFEVSDEASTAKFIEQTVENYGLHIEIGTKGWSGLPLYAATMPIAFRHERLVARQKGAAAQIRLTWGDVCNLSSYTEGQTSRLEAAEQSLAQYFAALEQQPPPVA